MVTFTVCIACVDKHIGFMEKTLESLQEYTVKPDKVIVSMSPKFLCLDLHAQKRRLEEKFPFLLCLVQCGITGFGENLNFAFEKVDTDYATVWGADDFFHPRYFEVMKYIIEKKNPNIITHSFDPGLTARLSRDPQVWGNIDVFDKIDLYNMKTYDDFYLRPEGDGKSRFYSRKYQEDNSTTNMIWMHYGFQTFKSHIIQENKYKIGKLFDWRSDTLFLVDMYNRYGDMIFIDENMVQYRPSNTLAVHK